MNRLTVTIHTNQSENRVTSEGADHLEVFITTAPVQGKANKHLIKILAEYYHIRQNQVFITHGLTSHQKVVEIWR